MTSARDARFTSSDSLRSGAPLRYLRTERFDEPLLLELGGALPGFEVAYETFGELDADRSNAVLVCHAISGDSHVTRHAADDAPGWWEGVVGPGCAIDTERWYVVCANVLGGCRGSTGPASLDPRTGRPYGRGFPEIAVGDMVRCQRRLLDRLGIPRLHAVVGGSLGGHQALAFATRFPRDVDRVVPIACSARMSAQSLAFDVVARNAIDRTDPRTGLALARMIGHLTYLSPELVERKFGTAVGVSSVDSGFEQRFAVGSYLAHQAERFLERFDPESYRVLSLAMDRFALGHDRASIARALEATSARFLVVGFSSDWLFPLEQSRELVDALLAAGRPVSGAELETQAGHDAFLLPEQVPGYAEVLRAFLEPAASEPEARPPESDARQRAVEKLLAGCRSVLEVGRSTQAALPAGATRLAIEPSAGAVREVLRRGGDALQGDERSLARFPDARFEAVVIHRSLSGLPALGELFREALRVAATCVVHFPNAATRAGREELAKRGRSGLGPSLPLERACTLPDLVEFAGANGLAIADGVGLVKGEARALGSPDLELVAEQLVLRLQRARTDPDADPRIRAVIPRGR